jgi:hypothetical protein
MTKKKSPAGRKKEPNTGRASVTLPATTWARVKAQAESNRRTIRATIEILVEGALDVAEGLAK